MSHQHGEPQHSYGSLQPCLRSPYPWAAAKSNLASANVARQEDRYLAAFRHWSVRVCQRSRAPLLRLRTAAHIRPPIRGVDRGSLVNWRDDSWIPYHRRSVPSQGLQEPAVFGVCHLALAAADAAGSKRQRPIQLSSWAAILVQECTAAEAPRSVRGQRVERARAVVGSRYGWHKGG